MKIIIACAGRKCPDAGYWTTEEGKKVKFVARPEHAPVDDGCIYARPDDKAASGKTWRELLLEYNRQWREKDSNPQRLLPAYLLYSNSVYRALVNKYGVENVFILSAGWGLIRADFLTPNYNITYKDGSGCFQRRNSDAYSDCNEMPASADEKIYLFSGKGYYELFFQLIQGKGAERIVFYASKAPPILPGCRLIKCESSGTNWHYRCARDFMDGKIKC